uniref:DUF7640 domain-containing protein n=1 Tax=Odontella aurita TaxID=265563 RepID=A0A7S4JLI8_9STRA|mmetsp:Transcript_48638/g.146634  ORF Transcript_48638/g.146634 Transcript_48638/m.146634 type:complete len:285 (+) Transcript_48638:542-1396(+)|eukprot:CAMPEP_0113577420 /NCGR_PEP_ID=MMETSP0015_2-20120614/28872_1 /TAXON_ID=2838 /ORGANISM="Odontella" /LENGTH=284 /DNA_ID=CAMNT_0000481025 /DNA_START=463 /DNA_END=1317 /DNA_ORIENTATION=+ /assembly_acc=CAM_ASM_000160
MIFRKTAISFFVATAAGGGLLLPCKVHADSSSPKSSGWGSVTSTLKRILETVISPTRPSSTSSDATTDTPTWASHVCDSLRQVSNEEIRDACIEYVTFLEKETTKSVLYNSAIVRSELESELIHPIELWSEFETIKNKWNAASHWATPPCFSSENPAYTEYGVYSVQAQCDEYLDANCCKGNELTCHRLKGIVCQQSCHEDEACLNAGYHGPIFVAPESCLGKMACNVKDDAVWTGSCLKEASCMGSGSPIKEQSCGEFASCYKNPSEIPAKSCNSDRECTDRY